MSVKWKNFKVIFRKANSINDPITDVQLPIVHDLLNDPGERWNLWETSMDMGWVLRPVTCGSSKASQSIPTSRRARSSRAIRRNNEHQQV
jgi:hypothetical protein